MDSNTEVQVVSYGLKRRTAQVVIKSLNGDGKLHSRTAHLVRVAEKDGRGVYQSSRITGYRDEEKMRDPIYEQFTL